MYVVENKWIKNIFVFDVRKLFLCAYDRLMVVEWRGRKKSVGYHCLRGHLKLVQEIHLPPTPTTWVR